MKLPEEIREFFRRQGARGGKTRARNLTAEQRSEGARRAVQARWAKAKAEAENEKSGEEKSKRGGKL
jgi:hypothetical protein